MSEYPIVSGEHALLAGMVWGLAIKHGLNLLPIQDAEGNYTAACELVAPLQELSGIPAHIRIVLVVQPPVVVE